MTIPSELDGPDPQAALQSLFIKGTVSLDAARAALDALAGEPVCHSEVRPSGGVPRLFINGEEALPFFALSTSLAPTAGNFRRMGIPGLCPIVSLRRYWKGPGQYDWPLLEAYLGALLSLHPEALLCMRLHLHSPAWWTKQHPEELNRYGLPTPEARYDLVERGELEPLDSGHSMDSGSELREVSFGSQRWRDDTAEALRQMVLFLNDSPLRSRIVCHFFMCGATGEWNYFGDTWLPGYGEADRARLGEIPTPAQRIYCSHGLLRDPAREQHVIDFYRAYHRMGPEAVVQMARTVKQALDHPVICGTFFGYLMEVTRIQDCGFLASQIILDCPDIELVAGPYTYQNSNREDDPAGSDMEDGSGNWLGRARGLGGDGAFRLMVESLRRRGKLYASEMDPSTYLDASDSWRSIGGSGSKTLEGSVQSLKRDIGRVFAEGVAGWLYDFGPLHGVPTGWFGGGPIIDAIKPLIDLLREQKHVDLHPVSEVLLLGDQESFHATRHWWADHPWPGQGIRFTDVFNHWFLNAQNRAVQRLGAPVDYLYRGDLTRQDVASRYKLILVPNTFLLEPDEVDQIRGLLRDSGATVVWYYAPGFLRRGQTDLAQMGRLTGFTFREDLRPGAMRIDAVDAPDVLPTSFGIKSPKAYGPRFEVETDAEILGLWQDTRAPAFARKQQEGWTSIYIGTAPLPAEWLRHLAREAGAGLWSDRPDIVSGCHSCAMVVATADGERTVTFPGLFQDTEGGPVGARQELDMAFGEVRLFLRRD